MRHFETGATRDTDEGKYDFEGFLSPLALEAFAQYMHANRYQQDGSIRPSDNWQLGIPKDAYMKSMWRHFFDVWKLHRGYASETDIIEALCALLFNVQGLAHEIIKERLTEAKNGYTDKTGLIGITDMTEGLRVASLKPYKGKRL